MLILKRLTIWAAEIILQAVLLGLLLIGFDGYDQHAFGNDLLTCVIWILIMFFLTGYLATTSISRAIWRGRKLWLYSVIATTLFLIHFEVLNMGIGGAFEPWVRVRIRMAGACFAFFSTLAGTAILQRVDGIAEKRPRKCRSTDGVMTIRLSARVFKCVQTVKLW
jgi:hypothetical protein